MNVCNLSCALALSAAHIGVAMGEGGAAMTIQAGDLVIMSDNLLRIPSAIKICRFARWIIIENFTFAIMVKIMAVILAVMGILELWTAVLVDLVTLLVVIANGLRPLCSSSFTNSNIDTIVKLKKLEENASSLDSSFHNATEDRQLIC